VALIKYAKSLLVAPNTSSHFRFRASKPGQRSNDQNGQAYVREFLWTSDASRYRGGAIKWDLDWVAVNYNAHGCDLWEEIQYVM
jgi:hypothetical protein